MLDAGLLLFFTVGMGTLVSAALLGASVWLWHRDLRLLTYLVLMLPTYIVVALFWLVLLGRLGRL